MERPRVIVFGATGDIGSVAARAAEQQGAQVYLAVRDLAKAVPGLSAQQELEGNFERVKTDLNDPRSVYTAVTQAKATQAFIYQAPGSDDGMKSAIAELKAAGIQFVVFLSSFSIQEDPRAVPKHDFIAWSHAQVEISLSQNFGTKGFVAVRPAYFASNILFWREMIQAGTAKIPYANATWDWISPGDIGRVCGTLLMNTFNRSSVIVLPNIIYLVGPQLLSTREVLADVERVMGKKILLSEVDYDEGIVELGKIGLPDVVARSVSNMWKSREENDDTYRSKAYEQGLVAIERITGKPPTYFREWLSENISKFSI